MTDPTLVAPRPRRAAGRRGVDLTSPFARLAVTHALSMGGEALVAISLASTLFFNVDPSEGRQKVLLGLLFTMAPFALVAPLIGPVMDRIRGGHRAVIIGAAALRAGVAFVMAFAVAADSLLLFPEAFMLLVLGKTYQVAKAAVVPAVVSSDAELVEANSKLQVLGGLSGFVAAIPGGILYLFGPEWVVVGCVVAFSTATLAATRLPATRVAEDEPAPAEVEELRSTEVVVAATSMAVVRAIVGFVTLLLAFALRGGADLSPAEVLARNVARNLGELLLRLEVLPVDEPPRWYFGVVVPLSVVGGLAGASVAPRIRRVVAEERMLAGALVLLALVGVLAGLLSGLLAYMVLAFFVAVASTAAKQAFDAVVQRDAPDANRGRSFARFEARFQVAWVIGAVVPVAIPLSVTVGAVMVAAVATGAAVLYALGGMPNLRSGRLTRGRAQRSGKSGMSGASSSSGSG